MHPIVQNLEPRVMRILSVAILVICAAALGSYVLWPMLKEVQDASETLTLLERVTNTGAEVDGEIKTAREKLADLEQALHGDMVNRSDHELEAFVLGRMQNISWRNQVELRSVKPTKGERVLEFEEVKFDVQVKGQYFDLFNWIRDLNRELGFVVVKKFFIRSDGNDLMEPDLLATFTVVSYRSAESA